MKMQKGGKVGVRKSIFKTQRFYLRVTLFKRMQQTTDFERGAPVESQDND